MMPSFERETEFMVPEEGRRFKRNRTGTENILHCSMLERPPVSSGGLETGGLAQVVDERRPIRAGIGLVADAQSGPSPKTSCVAFL